MTDVLTGQPSAAWYPDPGQPEVLRWWDGSAWSVHTMARPDDAPPLAPAPDLSPVLPMVPQSIPEPMPFASGVSLGANGPELRGTEPPQLSPIERAARAEVYAKLASSHATQSVSEASRPAGDTFGGLSNPSPVTWSAPTARADSEYLGPLPSSTAGGWLLAWSPWLGVGAVGFHTFQLVQTGPDAPAPIIAGYVLAALLPFVFAGVDRAGLRGRGHVRRPSWWWMLLGPLVYFIARTVALTRQSRLAFVPLLVWVVNLLVASVALALLLPTFIQGVIETEAEKQLATMSATEGLTEVLGTTFDVTCPDGVLVPPFTCHVTSDRGLQLDLDVAIVNGALAFAVDESTLVVPGAN